MTFVKIVNNQIVQQRVLGDRRPIDALIISAWAGISFA